MKIDNTNKLAFFQELFNEASSFAETKFDEMEKNLKQYQGSKEIDGGEDATVIRNITYELIESQVTSYLPTPSVQPKMTSEKNDRNAKAIETLLKNKRDELPFEKLNDMDERYSPIYGGSVWLVEWDNSIMSHNTVGDVKITCVPPKKFIGQPKIYDVKDMEYCFIKFETTKEDIVRKYGVLPTVADETTSEDQSSADDKTATLIVCYYKNQEDKVCQYVWSSDTELLSIDNYFARKVKKCTKCGQKEELCHCDKPHFETASEDFEELSDDIVLSDGTIISYQSTVIKDGQVVMTTEKQPVVLENGQLLMDDTTGISIPVMQDVEVPKLEPTKIPFYTPNILPIVIRKNTSEEDNLFGQSDCQFIRPQQQAINKIESRIAEKLFGSGVFPTVPDDFRDDLDNSVWKKAFRIRKDTIGMFGRIDLQVSVQQDMEQSERLYNQAKRILGISDSYQGQADNTATSGIAKQVQVAQSAGRLDSKRQMKNAAYAEIDQIIFQYYLAYADEPRPATYVDSTGRRQNYMFNRYDFVQRDDAGEYYYDDEYLFAADSTINIDKQKEQLWAENMKNFQMGTYGNPQLPQTLLIYWQNMEKLRYPFARDNVERLKEEIQRQAELVKMQENVNKLQQEVSNRQGYEQYLMQAQGDVTK